MNYTFLQTMYELPPKMVSEIRNEPQFIEMIRHQFKSRNARTFIDFTGIPLKTWAEILPVSKRTLERELCDGDKVLDLKLSEPLVEIGEIFQLGLMAFDGRKERLRTWLFTENPYFSNKRPMEMMDSHKGRDMVKAELIRIDYGEFG
jgi:uncharacterized protein (DUF2384 family)